MQMIVCSSYEYTYKIIYMRILEVMLQWLGTSRFFYIITTNHVVNFLSKCTSDKMNGQATVMNP